MRRRALMIAAAAALSLSACSGQSVTGLDQMIYNATYSGTGAFWVSFPAANSPPPTPTAATMTLAQLGRDFTGTFTVTNPLGRSTFSGSVSGRTTSTGGDFTIVIPPPCAGTLYGSFTVSNSRLTGSADGRDCGTDQSGNNVHVTFTNLVRQ